MPIRPARSHEAGEIAELWEELVAYHRKIDPALPKASRDGVRRYAHAVIERVRRDDSVVYVAVDARGRIVGYALAITIELVPETFEQQQAGFLADIYVQPQAQRQGHGRALVSAVMNWCAEHGLNTLEWEVAATNTAGRAFWQSMRGRELMVRMRADVNNDANNKTLSNR
jgi:GNAT superfamily N-acetyltransferase